MKVDGEGVFGDPADAKTKRGGTGAGTEEVERRSANEGNQDLELSSPPLAGSGSSESRTEHLPLPPPNEVHELGTTEEEEDPITCGCQW